MKRNLAILFAIGLFAIGCLNASGFCYKRPGYLSVQELYKAAVLRQEDYMAGAPKDPSLRDKFATEFVAAHPQCCSIVKSEALGSSLLADLFGFKYFLVRVVYALSNEQIEQAPSDGNFYEVYVEVSSCGTAMHTHGQRLKEWPQDAGRLY